ncbi:MAG: DNA-3-methyladenine glycosylase family protein, partial [Candidatus Dormibacteria bacterium]
GELDWVTRGAGRMLRGQSVFEDVVKTICTTNCSWSATVRMVGALVSELGQSDGQGSCAFPTPQALAQAGEDWYRERARTGYRGTYLRQLAVAVADGRLDLEGLRDPELPDPEVERRLLALPGVGPYAAAHIMLTSLGRYHMLVLDSWTRPTYQRLIGRAASDTAIRRRFARFGDFRGLAFWLYLTRGWMEDSV